MSTGCRVLVAQAILLLWLDVQWAALCARCVAALLGCHSLLSQITPYNEPNDIIYPATYDQPDNCAQPYYLSPDSCHRFWTHTTPFPPALNDPQPGVLACPKQ